MSFTLFSLRSILALISSEDFFSSGKGNQFPYYCLRITEKGALNFELSISTKFSSILKFKKIALKQHIKCINEIIGNLDKYSELIHIRKIKIYEFRNRENNFFNLIVDFLGDIGKNIEINKKI